MVLLLYVIGCIIISLGYLFSFIDSISSPSGNAIIVSTNICGVFFLVLGKLIDLLIKKERKFSEKGDSEAFPTTEFKVTSKDFEVYDSFNETFKFFMLDGNEFLQARVFKNYIDITKKSFVFKLPNREKIELTVFKNYSQVADMFSKDEIIFVKLSSINISSTRLGDLISISYINL